LRRSFQPTFATTGSEIDFATLQMAQGYTHSPLMKKLILLMALAACSPPAPSAPQPPVQDALPSGLGDTCNAVRYHTLLNQDATALERILILGQVRIIRPGTITTQDYLPERMNFHVGTDGKIAKISCG
jgi:hypothetical protein